MRSCTFSLSKLLARYVLTVFSLTFIASAISAFVQPCATRLIVDFSLSDKAFGVGSLWPAISQHFKWIVCPAQWIWFILNVDNSGADEPKPMPK